MLYGIFIGFPTFRLRGPFFTLTSIALLELLKVIFIVAKDITGGSVGLTVPFRGGNPLYFQFRGKLPYYYVGIFLLIITLVVSYLVKNSKLGYCLQAIRDDQDAAEVVGVPLLLLMSADAYHVAATAGALDDPCQQALVPVVEPAARQVLRALLQDVLRLLEEVL